MLHRQPTNLTGPILCAQCQNTARFSRNCRRKSPRGKYEHDKRLPSETQLVERFKVSRATAARALLDLQTQGVIERRKGSGSFVCSTGTPNSNGATRELGLLIPRLGNVGLNTGIWEAICSEIASHARARDYMLLWDSAAMVPPETLELNISHAEKMCEQYIQRRVAGVFVVPYSFSPENETVNQRLANRLRKAGTAVVLLDRDFVDLPRRSEFDLVMMDNFRGGYLIGQHLIKMGCRRIAFVQHPLAMPNCEIRFAGVSEAARSRNMELPTSFAWNGDLSDRDFLQQVVADPKPDAIACATDSIAARVIQGLAKTGIRVPHDVRVTGFDDLAFATLIAPPLTTIHQPCHAIGQFAFRAMLDRIGEPSLPTRTITLNPKLVVRESCGAYD